MIVTPGTDSAGKDDNLLFTGTGEYLLRLDESQRSNAIYCSTHAVHQPSRHTDHMKAQIAAPKPLKKDAADNIS